MIFRTRYIPRTIALICVTLICGGFAYFNVNWNIEPNYAIKFSGVRSEGTLTGLVGKIRYASKDLAHSYIDVSADLKSIKTGNETKDEHAKSSGWLDAEKYPVVHFVSSSFQQRDGQTFVIGLLELHGVKKEIVIPFTFDESKSTPEFLGSFNLNLADYGIKGGGMGFMMDKTVKVSLRVPVKG